MSQRIVFTGKQQVAFESFTPPAPSDKEVRVRTLYSLMSTGTENIVFNRLFDPGTHWDKWVKYPFYPGYLNVGVVEQVGAAVTGWKTGDRVVSRSGHCTHFNFAAEANQAWKLADGLDPQEATWFGLAKIAAMGARAAQCALGDSVLVIGAGPVGQMSVRWAAAAGCASVLVIDPVEMRLKMAQRGGATATLAVAADQAAEQVRAANSGKLPRIVVDTTGHAQVFAAALPLAADRGRVVLLGDTGSPAQQHLSTDVVFRGLTIVGAHDGHEDAQWNSPSIYHLFARLIAAGRFNLSGLITHTFTPDQCVAAYQLANTKRSETMGILFDWTKTN